MRGVFAGLECFFRANVMFLKHLNRPLNNHHQTCYSCEGKPCYVSLDDVRTEECTNHIAVRDYAFRYGRDSLEQYQRNCLDKCPRKKGELPCERYNNIKDDERVEIVLGENWGFSQFVFNRPRPANVA
ncbi:MAG: hypothetical protein ABIH37_04645 [archaeon]